MHVLKEGGTIGQYLLGCSFTSKEPKDVQEYLQNLLPDWKAEVEYARMTPSPLDGKPNTGAIIQMRKGDSLLTFFSRYDQGLGFGGNKFKFADSTHLARIIGDLDKYKLVGYFSTVVDVSDKKDSVIHWKMCRDLAAFRGGVKIGMWLPVGAHNYSSRERVEVYAQDTLGGSNYHRIPVTDDSRSPRPYNNAALPGFLYDLKLAIKAANSEVARLSATDKSNLPAPFNFSYPDFGDYHWDRDFLGKGLGISRDNQLNDVAIFSLATLRNDGSFVPDANDPNSQDVWIIAAVTSYNCASYLIAIKDDQWYEVQGEKTIRIHPSPTDLKLTPLDRDLIVRSVGRWIKTD